MVHGDCGFRVSRAVGQAGGGWRRSFLRAASRVLRGDGRRLTSFGLGLLGLIEQPALSGRSPGTGIPPSSV